MNIFHPRVDRRGNSNGITGMQFPSFEYTVALAAQVTGYFDGLNRWIAFLYFAMGMAYFYALLRLLYNDCTIAFCGTWAFTFSPILYYHSITALPDVLALSASIAGLYYFMRWDQEKKWLLIFGALVFTTLAGLTKLQYLAIGFPIAVQVFNGIFRKRYTAVELVQLGLFALLSVSVSLLWYVHAIHLIEISGLRDFGIEFRPVHRFAEGLKILTANVFSHLPEQLLSFPNLIPFFLLISWCWKHKPFGGKAAWLAVWALGLLVYHIVELRQMDVHMYYMFPYLPLLFLLVAKGYALLLNRRQYLLVLLILISLPILAFAGNFHHFLNEQKSVPGDFYNEQQRAALDAAIPDSALVIVGPDVSGCIYHYFTHTKGWSFARNEDLTAHAAEDCLQKGARYLIWQKDLPVPSGIAPHIAGKAAYHGTDLEVYLIR